jgi:hypothetical protein
MKDKLYHKHSSVSVQILKASDGYKKRENKLCVVDPEEEKYETGPAVKNKRKINLGPIK